MEDSADLPPSFWKQIFLWVVFLPAAWLGAMLSYYAVQNMVPPGEHLDPEDIGLVRITGAHAMWGLAFVWVGTQIVPKGKIHVAIILAGLSFIFFGLPAMLLIKAKDWLNLIPPGVGIASTVACAVHLINGEIHAQRKVQEAKKRPVPCENFRGHPSMQLEMFSEKKVLQDPAPKYPTKAIAPASQNRLCSCAESSPGAEFRHWPGTKDSVMVFFCQKCKKPVEEAWAAEPEYSIAQSKLRPPYRL